MTTNPDVAQQHARLIGTLLAAGVGAPETGLQVTTELVGSGRVATTRVRAAASYDVGAHRTVTLDADVTAVDRVVRAVVTVTYDVDPVLGLDVETVVGQHDGSILSDQGVRNLVAETVHRARLQQAADQAINRPQQAFNVAHGSGDIFGILSLTIHGVGPNLSVVLQDSRSDRMDSAVLDLDPATGALVGGSIQTAFGEVVLDGSNLDVVGKELEAELACALQQWDTAAHASRARLEERLAGVLGLRAAAAA